ncbi:MAG: ubiquinone/menaquinone biosynthesis methyltransferase [Firmicutes bacterium]|nr:ubiquinone/menaquinone biosynthesis methyltransferase [Bacillota bacterium]
MLYDFEGSALIYDAVVKRMIPEAWRIKCAGLARGKVLEVGIGTGLMLPFYDSGVSEVVGIDFSAEMLARAAKLSKSINFPVRLERMDVENLSLESAAFDTVVSSFMFCSVKHPLQGLSECRRVLRRGGRIILMEHVESRKFGVSTLLKLANPLSVLLLGDHLTRDTLGLARDAGFHIDRVENLHGDLVLLIVGTVAE